jgi:2-dehydro-3-deoxy-L-rhamnonate dehydrogenase (NAD+)
MNRYDLTGRVALVTGGASGLGAAAAAALVAAGARVAVFDLRAAHTGECVLQGDIANSAQVSTAVDRIHRELGEIDILINSAGIPGPWQSALTLDQREWTRIMTVNATGTFNICRAVVPEMVARGYGRVVLISSVAGKEGNPLLPAYSASKAAVIAFGKSIAQDVAGSGVLVNVVTPAVFETRMAIDQPAAIVERMVSSVPLRRMGQPSEAAALICWLCSEDCSFSTGAVFDISGGRSVY